MKINLSLLVASITAASLMAGTAHTQSIGRIPVTELKPLLKLAIEHGQARGVLTGASADYMKHKFGTASALEIDVRSLHPLPQPGCSRLEVTNRQRGVMEKGKREHKSLTYQLNYCRDGGFPSRK